MGYVYFLVVGHIACDRFFAVIHIAVMSIFVPKANLFNTVFSSIVYSAGIAHWLAGLPYSSKLHEDRGRSVVSSFVSPACLSRDLKIFAKCRNEYG